MVSSLFSVPVSGLRAAESRLFASANNTANQFSTSQQVRGETVAKPYEALEAVDTSLEPAGVKSSLLASGRPFPKAYDPESFAADENGFVTLPNTDQIDDATNRILAKNQFKANLSVIEAEDETLGNLLDIKE